MSKSLVRKTDSGGVVPAVCSGFLPGLGQLVNGETDKAIGVFAVSAIAGVATQIPVIGWAAGIVAGGTWLYGIVDGYIGRRRR
jgi:hypothetical protein